MSAAEPTTPAEPRTRTVLTLSVGARIGAVLSILLLLGAAYLFWSPLQLYPQSGFPVQCGSAAAPPNDELGRAACGSLNKIRQWQAGSFVAAAAILCAGSVYAFGVKRREELLLGAAE